MKDWRKIFNKILSYVIVAVLAGYAGVALSTYAGGGNSKLAQLEQVILDQFVGQADQKVMEDAAANAMVESLGDRWSYYIPAEQYESYLQHMKNEYVGIGITITVNSETKYLDVVKVESGSGAYSAGILPGDVVIKVEGQDVAELGLTKTTALIRGEEGTVVRITVLRDGKEMDFTATRQTITVQVAKSQMLEGNVGLVQIANFDEKCANQTIAAIEALLEQGAESLIFDVRFNPGGYQTELVALLDYLLPEGDLFRSRYYGELEKTDTSDEKCLEMPMAVIVNAESYSAAEFFAAALEEYDWAVVVGEPTCGKGYFQITIPLVDGSAVGLSVGEYFTPKGVSLAEVGGLKPAVESLVDKETAAKIQAGMLPVEEDTQIQAAWQALKDAS